MPDLISDFMTGLYTETANMLDKYRSPLHSALLRNPRYEEVSKIIELIHHKRYLKFSDLVRDLDQLISNEVPLIFHFDDILPELIERIKDMHKQKLLYNMRLFPVMIKFCQKQDYLLQLLDAISTLDPHDQITLFHIQNNHYYKGSLLKALLIDVNARSGVSDSEPSNFELFAEFICNLLEITKSIDHPAVQTNHQNVVKKLLTNSTSDQMLLNGIPVKDNLLIQTIIKLKRIPQSLLRLCEYLGPHLQQLLWNNEMICNRWFMEVSDHVDYHVFSALGYAMDHAPNSIGVLLKTISCLDSNEQIHQICCAVFGSFFKTVNRKNPERSAIKLPHDIDQNKALQRFFTLRPLLPTTVWTQVLLREFEPYRQSLLEFAVRSNTESFSEIVNLIKDLPPEEKIPFLTREFFYSQKNILELAISYRVNANLIQTILDAIADLPVEIKISIFSHSTKDTSTNLLLEAYEVDSSAMATIRNEIDKLPPENKAAVLDQIDWRKGNMLMRAMDWDIESFKWYLAYLEKKPHEHQISALLHTDVGWHGCSYQRSISDDRGNSALLLALQQVKSEQLMVFFDFISKAIYWDEQKNHPDTVALLKLLRQTNLYGLNALTASLSQNDVPDFAFHEVYKLLQLIPVSLHTELGFLILQNTPNQMNCLLLAVQNNRQDAIHSLLSLAKKISPSCIVSLCEQHNSQEENCLMLAMIHNHHALPLLLNELTALPETEQCELFCSLMTRTNKEGRNVLDLAILHYPESVSLLLPIIELLPLDAQAKVFCPQKTDNDKTGNPLLLAINKCQNPSIALSIHQAITKLDEHIPGFLKEAEAPARARPYTQYFFKIHSQRSTNEDELVDACSLGLPD
ncbi:hypothetical protein [Legionella worsleiensis]|uniref:Ankyrin repeats (3 copies) n=1 Tax=Legionella worsleiensis TaxID=45076 RepID=A0A0W1A3C3_9GAMM|nr:hypothetical protein [Legionella worsleiensis]KTD75890.1 hypothetical protein Lwor_2456 [Legionella worsleiensis]STY32903.1 Uncharacterised protein [Legionella worsleiensis]